MGKVVASGLVVADWLQVAPSLLHSLVPAPLGRSPHPPSPNPLWRFSCIGFLPGFTFTQPHPWWAVPHAVEEMAAFAIAVIKMRCRAAASEGELSCLHVQGESELLNAEEEHVLIALIRASF